MLPHFGVADKHYPATPERPGSAAHGHLGEGTIAGERVSENPAETPFRY